jgi:hypothetical protein
LTDDPLIVRKADYERTLLAVMEQFPGRFAPPTRRLSEAFAEPMSSVVRKPFVNPCPTVIRKRRGAEDPDVVRANFSDDLRDRWAAEAKVRARAELCPSPSRNGRHETYLKPDGSTVCKACGLKTPAAPTSNPFADALADAIDAEREACARVAEAMIAKLTGGPGLALCRAIAADIRRRS